MRKIISGMILISATFSVTATSTHHPQHAPINYAEQFAKATPAKQVKVEQCWVRLLPASVPSAGYLTIYNQNDEAIEVLAAQSPSYGEIMLHESYEEDGMTKMRHVDQILIPAKDSLTFQPGGLHLMYEQPTGALQIGESMELTLLLSHEQKISTSCKVNPAKARSFE